MACFLHGPLRSLAAPPALRACDRSSGCAMPLRSLQERPLPFSKTYRRGAPKIASRSWCRLGVPSTSLSVEAARSCIKATSGLSASTCARHLPPILARSTPTSLRQGCSSCDASHHACSGFRTQLINAMPKVNGFTIEGARPCVVQVGHGRNNPHRPGHRHGLSFMLTSHVLSQQRSKHCDSSSV